jgi:predicted HicB family RNase H-like nuclease
MINYKGYIGHFTFDETKNIFYGRVINSHDLIIFQGKSIKETQEAFQDAINEHLEWCKKYGKKPEKPANVPKKRE